MKTLLILTLMVGLGNSQTKPRYDDVNRNCLKVTIHNTIEKLDGDYFACDVIHDGKMTKAYIPIGGFPANLSPDMNCSVKGYRYLRCGFGDNAPSPKPEPKTQYTIIAEPAFPPAGRFICWFPAESTHKCINSKGEDVTDIVYPVMPQPMDVPAVKEMKWMPADCNSIHDGVSTAMACPPGYQKQFEVDTCADKRRVLLTDEGGGKHCILFPKESK